MNIQIKFLVLLLFTLGMLSFHYPEHEVIDPTLVVEPIVVTKVENSNLPRLDLRAFLYDLAERESNNTPTAVNRWGYMGKYQFSPVTLWSLGKRYQVTRERFLKDVTLQDSAAVALLRINYQILQDIIDEYDGTTYNGFRITTSGILAGAHLVGPSGIRAFFDSTYRVRTKSGKLVRPRIKDGNGTHVLEYIELFSGYDVI